MSATKISDKNPLTDTQRGTIQFLNRGKRTRPGMVREFCSGCGLPTEMPEGEKLGDWQCEDCAPAYVESHNHGIDLTSDMLVRDPTGEYVRYGYQNGPTP